MYVNSFLPRQLWVDGALLKIVPGKRQMCVFDRLIKLPLKLANVVQNQLWLCDM